MCSGAVHNRSVKENEEMSCCCCWQPSVSEDNGNLHQRSRITSSCTAGCGCEAQYGSRRPAGNKYAKSTDRSTRNRAREMKVRLVWSIDSLVSCFHSRNYWMFYTNWVPDTGLATLFLKKDADCFVALLGHRNKSESSWGIEPHTLAPVHHYGATENSGVSDAFFCS